MPLNSEVIRDLYFSYYERIHRYKSLISASERFGIGFEIHYFLFLERVKILNVTFDFFCIFLPSSGTSSFC